MCHFFPRLVHKFNSILIEIQARHFVELDAQILKLIWLRKGLRITIIILKKKDKGRGLSLPETKIYYKVIIIKTCGIDANLDK